MSPLERGFAREREAARVLGGRRIPRAYGRSAPDLEPLTLPSGETIICEVKHRARLPRLLSEALEQAARYLPSATPVAVVSERHGAALAVLALRDFARLVGLVSLAVPKARKAKQRPSQMVMELDQ